MVSSSSCARGLSSFKKKKFIKSSESDQKSNSSVLKKNVNGVKDKEKINVAQLLLERKNLFCEVRSEFKRICEEIVVKPEENLYKIHVMLKKLDDYNNTLPSVIKFTLKTLTFIFLSIVPGYAINSTEESSNNVQLTKEMKKIRDFENNLLVVYQKFLKKFTAFHLYTTQKYLSLDENLEKNSVMIYKNIFDSNCEILCELLKNLHHFNYFEMLVYIAIKILMANGSKYDHNKQLIVSTFEYIFQGDESGCTTSIVVSFISKTTKKNLNKISTTHIIDLLLHVKLNEAILKQAQYEDNKYVRHKEKLIERKNLSRKEKKVVKELKKLEKEFKDIEYTEKMNNIKKYHSQILSQMCAIYFRILKQCDNVKSNIFRACLSGVSKYGHLIRPEFFHELINYIKLLVNQKDLFSFDDTVNALNALINIIEHSYTYENSSSNVQNSNNNLSTDCNLILQSSYNLIDNLANISERPQFTEINNFISVLTRILLSNHFNVTLQIMLAFIKKICTILLHLDDSTTIDLLSLIKTLFTIKPQLHRIIDQEMCSGKLYRPELENPQFCCADGTLCYEMALLKYRTNPKIKKLVNDIISIKK